MTLSPHQFWQTLEPPATHEVSPAGGFVDFYPATLPDGKQLRLPIRVLPGDGNAAVASFIVNQASFAVEDALADAMAELAHIYAPDVIIGVPTLGLPLANGVARRLGHSRMIALGTSRKFWYRDDLSEPMSSITSPLHAKRIYLDPRLLPLLENRRVVVVDDVVSSGASMLAVLRLLLAAGIRPEAVVVAMQQGTDWQEPIEALVPGLPVLGAIRSPRLTRVGDGWVPEGE